MCTHRERLPIVTWAPGGVTLSILERGLIFTSVRFDHLCCFNVPHNDSVVKRYINILWKLLTLKSFA